MGRRLPTPHGIPPQLIRGASALVLLSLVVQHGFPIGSTLQWWFNWLDGLMALLFAADLVLAGIRRTWRQVLSQRRFEYLLFLLFLGLLGVHWILAETGAGARLDLLRPDSARDVVVHIVDVFLLLSVGIQVLRGIQRLFGKGVRPELILAGSFGMLILIGTLLLLLPNSSANPVAPIGLIDALFTSTSATCVTGLVVRDPGSDFSDFGQAIILALFQMGGLGVITFVAFLSVFSSRTFPVPQMIAFRQIVNAPNMPALKRQIAGILIATVVIEATGIVLLYQFLPAEGDPFERAKWCVFHAVSAFCNAGFALQRDSLVAYQANAGMIFTLMALIVLGGLGFLVIPELLGYRFTRTRLFRRIGFFRRLHAGRAPRRLSVQTRLSLLVTLTLLGGGWILFWALEYSHSLRGHTILESFLISAFQAVTPRTAGFNTVPIEHLQDATLVFLMALMAIGASPVSMGGGIKTVSIGILLLALRAMVFRREKVEAFGRTIPGRTLFAALSVFVLYVVCAITGVFLLALFDPQIELQDQAFEVISALSTVGLSTGITADLSPGSKLVLCVAMFIGRVGPISLVLSVFQSRHAFSYAYPEEEVVVG